jgi:ubiquinone/menaquinone biosynthesis C-methylase UbiE
MKTADIEKELAKDRLRARLLTYTRKALGILPKIENPWILDIGCGSGVATIELAVMTDGEVTGLDIDQSSLDKLDRKAREAGVADRLRTVRGSMAQIDLPRESFNIIWAEGSISFLGFRNGLLQWRRLLKEGGYLVVHDSDEKTPSKFREIETCGYRLLHHFTLPPDVWWTEYYAPLQKKIDDLKEKYCASPAQLRILEAEQREVDMVRANPDRYGSVFFIMQKI